MKLFVPGTFDGVGKGELHQGHKELFDWALHMTKEPIIVLVNGDALLEGRKDVVDNERARANHVKAYVGERARVYVVNELQVWLNTASLLSPSYMLHGDDHSIKTLSEIYQVPEKWWEQNDVRLIFKPRYAYISSTELRENAIKKS